MLCVVLVAVSFDEPGWDGGVPAGRAYARPVAQLADELGVCWHTVMTAVREHGQPLVDDPDRVGVVPKLGVAETSFLKATRDHSTLYATGLVDLDERIVIDVVRGNTSRDLGLWLDAQPDEWLAKVRVVATDLAGSYRSGLVGRLDHAIRVADPFYVVRVANRCLDKVRCRVQNQTLGHRGRKKDPLYRIRKLMLTGAERLDGTGVDRMLLELRAGDPGEDVLGAWLAKESVRDVYLTNNPADAELLLDKAIEGCRTDWVQEIRSLGGTLTRWRTEILNHHHTGVERADRRPEPPRQEGQTRWPRIPMLHQLPTTDTPPRRRRRLALKPPLPAAHPNPHSPLGCVEPEYLEDLSRYRARFRYRPDRRDRVERPDEPAPYGTALRHDESDACKDQ